MIMPMTPTFRCLVHQQKRAFSVQTCSYAIRRVKVVPRDARKLGLVYPRTRFAPSPTGFVHLGSLRTALFNFLIAKKYSGQFLLRIEDTDQSRTKEGSLVGILDVLTWAKIPWDEGPTIGGPHSPYIQSERLDIYHRHIHRLLETGTAYRCFCTKERLANISSGYDRKCIHISPEESRERANNQEPHVIRLKSPEMYPAFHDTVYGEIQYGDSRNVQGENLTTYDDIVLLKTDGIPTYHFANVVDDHMMKISHVVRGTEWMPSTPKHVYLYQAFGWKVPAFVHLGLLQNADGTKLSKRHGGDNVNVEWYIAQGYLPQAIVNFVALLGWRNPRSNDVMDMTALIDNFTITNVTRGNMIVDMKKLDFLQNEHVKAFAKRGDPNEFKKFCTKIALEVCHILKNKHQIQVSRDYAKQVVDINVTKFRTYSTFVESNDYFFLDPVDRPIEYHGILAAAHKQLLESVVHFFEELVEWDHAGLTQAFAAAKASMLKDNPEADPLPLYAALRYAVTGGKPSPSIYDTLAIIGRERCLRRMKSILRT